MSPFPMYNNTHRSSPALYYTGHNAIQLREFAKMLDTELNPSGHHTFRFWSDADDHQRVMTADRWVIIDEHGELSSVSVDDFAKHWHPEDPTSPMPPVEDKLEELPVVEMTQDEFIAKRQEHMDKAREKLESLKVAEVEPPQETPATTLENGTREDRSGWTKEQWLHFRVNQGYSKNQINKLSKPVLAALPDEAPT